MRVAIVGAGIGGLCTAVALQNLGLDVSIYEAAPVIKPVGAGIGLAANAILGLKRLGIEQAVFEKGHQVTSLRMLDADGKIISNQDTELLGPDFANANLVIHRSELHEVLLSRLLPNSLHLNRELLSFRRKKENLILCFSDGSSSVTNLLIAADGIRSVVRQQLIPDSKPRYAGYTCWRAVIENPNIPLNEMASVETWTAAGRVGMSPLSHNRIYWYCCMNAKENDSCMREMKPKDLADSFLNAHTPIAEIIRSTAPEQLIWSDVFDIKPLQHFVYEDNIVLVGDAAHATTPNMGQGACQAIEDAVVLAQCLATQSDLATALKQYEKRRVKRTKRIIWQSRLLGWMAHWESPFWCRFRNGILRSVPKIVTKKQIAWLFKVDF
ncbi:MULTISPECIES: FAD-dependent monooxygenase [Olivibacter]|jgi:2-polyprenyl-6-methoxyphenol hydroxylase-like FAD-dependent oxidoreductase|uniref:FAD-dependent monooxygenase n=1 Tax=Olivibacter oleidegradans TaxID=760123 RepID=A0ABV6HTA6_9SPHI|nr:MULTISPECIES: FAD-dependent monooxygenase [Olivibacter]MDM8174441.1 FAD-dependent monooxygenase [Olivibacter sp. 47]QEL01313.1 monooxygenase [Olivibacter sp. LS-1]